MNFKTKVDVFLRGEAQFQKKALRFMVCSMLLFFAAGIVFPIAYSNVGVIHCAPTTSVIIYGVYAAYVLFSTSCEVYII